MQSMIKGSLSVADFFSMFLYHSNLNVCWIGTGIQRKVLHQI